MTVPRIHRFHTLLVAALLASLIACAPAQEAEAPGEGTMTEPVSFEEPEALEAQAILSPREGGTITGTVTFIEEGGVVEITAHVEGAPAGLHGFHVHEVGDCSADDFTSAGGHFNPTGHPHAGPSDAERHAGDLGNIEVGEDGVGHLQLSSDLLTVSAGPSSVVGRAVIFHEGEDDLASQPTGDAGGRLACGVVQATGFGY